MDLSVLSQIISGNGLIVKGAQELLIIQRLESKQSTETGGGPLWPPRLMTEAALKISAGTLAFPGTGALYRLSEGLLHSDTATQPIGYDG